EFIVDAWAATEQNRLWWIRKNQPKLRVKNYKGLADLGVSGNKASERGQTVILPSTFICGPRIMYEIYQDSMAITR
ncbi:hypothetical protein MKW98_020818, partial [Papaver atlanticum]